MYQNHLYAIFQALLAALLFGASAPLAKQLLDTVEPTLLAAFLYLGSAVFVLIIKTIQRLFKPLVKMEAKIQKADLIWLVSGIVVGGIVAPNVLLISLRDTPAATASLLLNFEVVATTLIATFAFKESVSRRAWGAIVTITLASLILTVNPGSQWGGSLGAIGILVACVLWGLDNNLTRNISAKDPLFMVIIRGLVAGTFSLVLAVIMGSPFPDWKLVLWGMALGSISYGLSLALIIWAMRGLGTARTSALFGTAPFAGVIVSFGLFDEAITIMFLLAIGLMVIGTLFLIYEEHNHLHVHEAISHEHWHRHDDGHHEHSHDDGEEYATSHSHWHEHPYCEHAHPHTPDIHHRHTH